jgi:hypothetical protein
MDEKLIYTCALFLTIFCSVSLWAKDAAPKIIDEHMDKMTQELSLNPDQAKKVKDILVETQKKVEVSKENERANRKKVAEEWKAIREQKDKDITSVLTDDQRKKFEAFKEKQKQKGASLMKDAMLKRLTKKLSLSEDQVKKVDVILERTHADIKATLNGKPFQEANREDLAPLLKKQDDEIAQVLNAEQLATFKSLREEAKHKKWHPKP